MNIVADGINGAWLQVIQELRDNGNEVNPRGQGSKEIKNMSIKITNPKKRLLTFPFRKISLPFAFGEFLWYLSGRNDVEMMEYYSRRMRSFSDDGVTLNSAYGYRIFGNHPQLPFDQWEEAVNKLRKDPNTRQAVIHLHTPNNKPTKDEVCTLSLQFMIRENKLDMFVNMRSNDIVWGFTYDVFSFTTFQELMANELGVELGEYHHNATSMHIYDKDYFYFDYLDIFGDLMYATQYDREFSYGGLTRKSEEWGALIVLETVYREFDKVHPETESINKSIKNESLLGMAEVFRQYAIHKKGSELDKKQLRENTEYDNIISLLMLNYTSGKKLNDSDMIILEGSDGAGKTTLSKELAQGKYDIISFAKPTDKFEKDIYFLMTLMTGDIILDRFFYSEWVYANHFGRTRRISWIDLIALENLLKRRSAQLIFVNTDSEICAKRLDEEDQKAYTENDIRNLQQAYETLFRMSTLGMKFRTSDMDKLLK